MDNEQEEKEDIIFSSGQIEWLRSMAALKLRPDDIVVLRHPGCLNEKAISNLRTSVNQIFGQERKVVVLEEGLDIGILRPVE